MQIATVAAKRCFNKKLSGLINACLLSALAFIAGACQAEDKKPQLTLVVSIQPLYLLAQEVLGDVVTVERLLPPGASPHGFQLAVSERRRLDRADLVLWVGPGMEAFLAPLVRRRPHLQADRLAGIEWPSSGAVALIPEHEHSNEHQHEHEQENEHTHDHSEADQHLWLNPANARVIAKALVAQLSEQLTNESDRAQLHEQLKQFLTRSSQNDQRWQAQLSAMAQQPWLVYHDALRHFQSHYQLRDYQIVTLSPEKRPGARHLYRLREQLQPGQCLLVEDYYPTQQAAKLAGEFNLQTFSIDPLGVSATSYQTLMQNLVDQISACLTAAAHNESDPH